MDTYYNDLGIFLYHTPIVCAFAAAFVLLINRHRTHSQVWLAVVFITLGLGMTASFMFDRYLTSNHREIMRPVNFITSLASSAATLFYFVALMQPRRLTKKFIGVFCSAWLAFSLVVCLPDVLSVHFHPLRDVSVISHFSSLAVVWRIIIDLCVMGLDIWLLWFILKMYREHRQFVSENYSFIEGINLSWIKIIIVTFVVLGVLDILWTVNSAPAFKMFFHIFSFIAIWVIFWFGFRQEEISYPDLPTNDWSKAKEEKMQSKDRMTRLKADLVEYFDNKKPFLNPELSLQDVATALGVSQYVLSRFINKEFEVNFYTLINRFRIDHVLRLIELNKSTFNNDALLAASGFRSRTVFFNQFKEKTGCTPQEYIEKKEKAGTKRGRSKKTPPPII